TAATIRVLSERLRRDLIRRPPSFYSMFIMHDAKKKGKVCLRDIKNEESNQKNWVFIPKTGVVTMKSGGSTSQFTTNFCQRKDEGYVHQKNHRPGTFARSRRRHAGRLPEQHAYRLRQREPGFDRCGGRRGRAHQAVHR